MRFHYSLSHCAVVAALLAPTIGLAQGPRSTGLASIGSTDLYYQISVNGGSFYDAFVLNRNPSIAGQYQWIGASAAGNVQGGQADQNLGRFAYSVLTTFTGGTATGFSYDCAIDDLFVRVVLNGADLGAGCDQYNLGARRTITGLNVGANTLRFDYTGNGITDGIVVNIASVTTSTVPEPATWLLLGTGLLAIGLAARRREE